MDFSVILQLAIATSLPSLASVVLMTIDKRYRYSKKNYWAWQLVVGVVFGLIAIFGTEFGIHTIDATMNVRDAAPLAAGLVFGGPAGIIAGIIGGVERWFAALWGRGMFTRLACSLGTVLSGVYAALIRRSILVDDKPNAFVGLAAGVVDEVLHLALVLITNMNSAQFAFLIVKACAFPMITCVGISTSLSALLTSLLDGLPRWRKPEERRVTWRIQNGVLVSLIFAFSLTSLFSAIFHTSMAEDATEALLTNTIADVQEDITDAAQVRMEETARSVTSVIKSVDATTDADLASVKNFLGLSEVFVVDPQGVIIKSSYAGSVGRSARKDEVLRSMIDSLSNVWHPVKVATGSSSDSFDRSRQYGATLIDGGAVVYAYDVKTFRSLLQEDVKRSAQNRRVGESGFLIMSDDTDDLVFNLGDSTVMEESYVQSQQELMAYVTQAPMGTLLEANFMERLCYVMGGEVEGYRVVVIYPYDEAVRSRDMSVLMGAFTEIIIFAMLFVAIFVLMNRDVVSCLQRVVDRLGLITDGDLDQVVDERSSFEFDQLSTGINMTVDALKEHIAEEAARIDQDLEYARAIQTSVLPSIFPPYPHHHEFDIYASMTSAKLVGGDFYDFFLIDNMHLAFLVADVSGKSVPGAMFMMRAKTLIRSIADQRYAPNEVFSRTNKALCDGNSSSMFVTAWMGVLDVETGHVQAVNAGHNPPARVRSDGTASLLKLKHNLILGCSDKAEYDLLEFDLQPGDTLFLYTDGVVEANDIEGDLFGEARMLEELRASCPHASSQEICEDLSKRLDAFVGEEPQFDDITMLSVKYLGIHAQRHTEEDKVLVRGGDVFETQAYTKNVDGITSFVERRLVELGCTDRARLQIDVALDEVFANICEYAYEEQPEGSRGRPIRVFFETLDGGRAVRVTFEDEGVPFDPLSIAEPDTSLGISERGIGGYGIYIVRQTMDDVNYERRGGHNLLSFTKSIN